VTLELPLNNQIANDLLEMSDFLKSLSELTQSFFLMYQKNKVSEKLPEGHYVRI